MKKSLKFALLIASVLLLTACQSADEPEPIDIPLTPVSYTHLTPWDTHEFKWKLSRVKSSA